VWKPYYIVIHAKLLLEKF